MTISSAGAVSGRKMSAAVSMKVVVIRFMAALLD
jgi:hypothetical protein